MPLCKVLNKSDVEFGTGNVPDTRLEVKKSLPEAKRFYNQQKTVVTLNSF